MPRREAVEFQDVLGIFSTRHGMYEHEIWRGKAIFAYTKELASKKEQRYKPSDEIYLQLGSSARSVIVQSHLAAQMSKRVVVLSPESSQLGQARAFRIHGKQYGVLPAADRSQSSCLQNAFSDCAMTRFLSKNVRDTRRFSTPLPLFRRLLDCSPSLRVLILSFRARSFSGDSDLDSERESSESGGVRGYSSSDSEVHAVALPAASSKRARISNDSRESIPGGTFSTLTYDQTVPANTHLDGHKMSSAVSLPPDTMLRPSLRFLRFAAQTTLGERHCRKPRELLYVSEPACAEPPEVVGPVRNTPAMMMRGWSMHRQCV